MVGNLVQIQDKLKDLSDKQLRDVFTKGTVPQFLVMTEMGRRKEMKEEYQKNQAQAATTVAEDILNPATKMAQGLGALARPQNRMATQSQNLPIEQSMTTMAPSPQPMANKLPVTRMADGGLAKIKAQDGISFNRDNFFRGGVFDPQRFAAEFYDPSYPGSPYAKFSPAATERSPSFRAARAMDRLFPQQPNDPLYDRRGRREAVGSLQKYLRNPDAYRRALLEAQNKAASSYNFDHPEALRGWMDGTGTEKRSVVKEASLREVPLEAGKEDAALLFAENRKAANALASQKSSLLPSEASKTKGKVAAKKDDVIYGSGSENVSPDASGLLALSTEIDNIASRQYRADPNLVPSALTKREAEVTKLLGVINPNAASASAGFKDKLKTREEGIEEARDEAQGFALIEAALRIAGSKGSTIGEAISDAAPALASYQKSAASLRKEESLIMGEQLKLAQLQEAEKAGRKAEAASLRKELGEIGDRIRSIQSENKKLFNQSKQADIAVLQARVSVANAQTNQEYKQGMVRLKKAEDERANRSAENIANLANIKINDLKDRLKKETNPDKRRLIGDQIRTQEEIKKNAITMAQAFAKYDPYKKATAESRVRGSIVSMLKQRTSVLDAQRKAQQAALTIQDPKERTEYLKRFDDSLKTIDAQITAANKTLKSIQDGSYTALGGSNRIIIPANQLPKGR
jgi:hypothetical protein